MDSTRPVKASQSAGGFSTGLSDSDEMKNAAEIISDEDDSGSESESEADYADQEKVMKLISCKIATGFKSTGLNSANSYFFICEWHQVDL